MVAAIGVDAYPFLAFSDLICRLNRHLLTAALTDIF